MYDFNVYALFNCDKPPQKLKSDTEKLQFGVELENSWPDQVVVFTRGDWRIYSPGTTIDVEVVGSDEIAWKLGTVTEENRCLAWEQSIEKDWANWGIGNFRLKLTINGQLSHEGVTPNLKHSCKKHARSGKELIDDSSIHSVPKAKEKTPKSVNQSPESEVPPLKESHGKRKRRILSKEEEILQNNENNCPNASSIKGTTPQRQGRPSSRVKQIRLFECHEDKTRTLSSTREEVPSGRWGQALCTIDDHTAILIGGQGSRMQFCKDSMWKLCTTTGVWNAAETIADGPTPECRIGHTATLNPETKHIYVFGGSKNKKWFNDVHILDTKTWKWSMVEAKGKVPPLAYHSTTMFRGELFVWGGVFPRPNPEPDGCSDSLYIFDPQHEIWYQPIVLGSRPAPRSGHSACLIQKKLYIFGGWDAPVCFNDMHILDLSLMEFSAVDVNGQPPSPRSWHASAVLSDYSFVIHGGYDGNNALRDTFIFNTESSTWTALVNNTLSATPRAGHSMITLATDQEDKDLESSETGFPQPHSLLIFGGGDNEGGFFFDTLTLPVDSLLSS
ncbi:kelch repeat-containing protein [Polypterus senegalus]|uniref:kelch repeat-containing protein n=1 Tax=Polypterus senegalus TaxID=55291 RepID=UPI001962548A|nr:kelch repeat-containing protein [Polypterus senegalus]